jgi:hypothetical protein
MVPLIWAMRFRSPHSGRHLGKLSTTVHCLVSRLQRPSLSTSTSPPSGMRKVTSGVQSHDPPRMNLQLGSCPIIARPFIVSDARHRRPASDARSLPGIAFARRCACEDCGGETGASIWRPFAAPLPRLRAFWRLRRGDRRRRGPWSARPSAVPFACASMMRASTMGVSRRS